MPSACVKVIQDDLQSIAMKLVITIWNQINGHRLPFIAAQAICNAAQKPGEHFWTHMWDRSRASCRRFGAD
jgi:hypothetical protein